MLVGAKAQYDEYIQKFTENEIRDKIPPEATTAEAPSDERLKVDRAEKQARMPAA